MRIDGILIPKLVFLVSGCIVVQTVACQTGDYEENENIPNVETQAKIDSPNQEGKEEAAMASEMLLIPAGEFTMGVSQETAENLVTEFYSPSAMISPYTYFNEVPAHNVSVKAFSMARYETRNSEFKEFLDDGGYQKKELWKELIELSDLNTDLDGWERMSLFTDLSGAPGPAGWNSGNFADGKDDHPVEGISWFEAVAYCRWKKKRLPTEVEWEYAARGTDQRVFSWGNDPSVSEKWGTRQAEESTQVGSILEDKSPFGVMDLARNVSEWVYDAWHNYPKSPMEPEEKDESHGIVRGGTYTSLHIEMRTTFRQKMDRLERPPGVGFRCAGSAR